MSNTISTLIKSTESSFEDKTSLDFGTEAHFAMQVLTANNFIRDTALKNPSSVKAAMINVAAIGLSLNPANKDAYLVPRDGAVRLDISYTGLIKLATNTGSIRWVQASIVFENDHFMDNGVGEKPDHRSNTFSDRGDPIGVYCVAKTIDGDYLTTAMNAAEIEAVRETSKAKDSQYSPWNTFPQEMWKKAVIKRASKTWPKTDQRGAEVLQEAIHVINQHEGNDFVPAVSDEKADYYAQLISDENEFGLFVFFQSLEIEDRVRIQGDYVSANAPHRQKMAFTDTLEQLLAAGRQTAEAYVESLTDEDESVRDEAIAELTQDELAFINQMIEDK